MGKMSKININNRKVKIRADGSVQVITENGSQTRTDQSFKDSQNVNSIMRRYSQLGYRYENLPEVAKGTYGDFTKVKDYKSAMETSIKVQDAFMQLPSEVRKRFYNDPQKLNEFMADPKNRQEAEKIGLLKPTPLVPPIPPVEEPKK